MIKDVAILTKYYRNYNYGGMLQGYALHRTLRKMGYSADIISYDEKKNTNPVYPSILTQARQYGVGAAFSKVFEKIVGKNDRGIRDLLAERRERFTQFMAEADAGTELYSDDTTHLLKQRYKTFVSGSDQVWNPNAVRRLFLQTFQAGSDRKISYAASIGRSALSTFEAEAMIPYLRKFGSVSVREKTAQKLLEGYLDRPVSTVLDPTMLLSPEEWDRLAAPRAVSEKYAAVYFFSDSLQVRKSAEEFCKKHGLRLVMIPYAKQENNLTDGKGPGERIEKVGPAEFVSLIRNADFVFTDSFHGAVFSIIYGKPFAVFERNKAGHVSMNSRLYDLLDTFGESGRLTSADRMDKMEEYFRFDGERIGNVLRAEQEKSLQFLRTAIEKGIAAYGQEAARKAIHPDAGNCSGCGACAEVCPQKCITMREDPNGFMVPAVDEGRCIQCGKCRRICPMEGNGEGHLPEKVFAAYTKEADNRSTSGGIGHAVSRRFMESGGVVYGAAYDPAMRVRISRAETPGELEKQQGSKYVQADMGGAAGEILADLRAGRKVLMTGTPCEAAGVLAAARDRKLADGLYTAEIICHGTPSPRMFADYLRHTEKLHGKKVRSVVFRARGKDTDKDFRIRTTFDDGSETTVSGFRDPYYRLFLSSQWFRGSCYECPFAADARAADITMGDFWNAEELPGDFGKGRRISVVLINTPKGQELFDAIRGDIEAAESDRETAVRGNPNLHRPTRCGAGHREYSEYNPETFFTEEAAKAPADLKRALFNQLPGNVRRNVKKLMNRKRQKT